MNLHHCCHHHHTITQHVCIMYITYHFHLPTSFIGVTSIVLRLLALFLVVIVRPLDNGVVGAGVADVVERDFEAMAGCVNNVCEVSMMCIRW